MAGPIGGSPFLTEVGEHYLPLPKHRGVAGPERSVWTTPVLEEVTCFVQAWEGSWGANTSELWGHRGGSQGLQAVGRNVHGELLWFGKFVRAVPTSPWHGYPADYRRKVHDRPPVSILTRWRDLGILAKHQVAKIAAGRRCQF